MVKRERDVQAMFPSNFKVFCIMDRVDNPRAAILRNNGSYNLKIPLEEEFKKQRFLGTLRVGSTKIVKFQSHLHRY